MQQGLVTIVIPIYNTEKYLDRCIESLVNQSYRNLEILLIDDGSPDNCPEMCEIWAAKDPRIRVIHKENAGLGMARNSGIDHASGEYICFFDSDDYIRHDTVEKAYRLAKLKSADIVIFGYYRVDCNGIVKRTIVPQTPKQCYSGQEVQTVFLADLIAPNLHTGERTNLWMSACACLYSTGLINRVGWRFVSEREIISEDIYSLLCLYRDVYSVAILPEAFYYYCENAVSLTHTYRKDRFEKINYFYTSCLEACQQFGYTAEVAERIAYYYLSNTIAALKMILKSDLKNTEKYNLIRQITDDTQMRHVLTTTDFRKESFFRKILILSMKFKIYPLVYWFVKLKA